MPHVSSALEWPGPDADRANAGAARLAFRSVDEFGDRIRAARPDVGWTAAQLSAGALDGSVVSIAGETCHVTCTRVQGGFQMRGPVSVEHLCIGLVLEMHPDSRQWLLPAEAGAMGIFQPGEAIDGVFRGRSTYVNLDLPHEILEAEAEREGVVIDARWLWNTGRLPGQIAPARLAGIARLVDEVHGSGRLTLPPGTRFDQIVLAAVLDHAGRTPSPANSMPQGGYGRIVARARAYIDAHLDSAIAIDDLGNAAFASRRTLHRAFAEILGETPQSYVLKLRLNRIRQELASADEAHRTVTMVAHQWGIPELGRMAARYREQFGELPSETLARQSLSRQSQSRQSQFRQ